MVTLWEHVSVVMKLSGSHTDKNKLYTVQGFTGCINIIHGQATG